MTVKERHPNKNKSNNNMSSDIWDQFLVHLSCEWPHD